jgi:hypothetical protein
MEGHGTRHVCARRFRGGRIRDGGGSERFIRAKEAAIEKVQDPGLRDEYWILPRGRLNRGRRIMSKARIASLCALALAMAMALPAAAQGFKHENNPDNLRALFASIHQTVYAKKDPKQAAALMQSVMPDEARVRKHFGTMSTRTSFQRIVSIHKSMPPVSER